MFEPESLIRGVALIEAYMAHMREAPYENGLGPVADAAAPYLEHDGLPDEDELWILLLDVLTTFHMFANENFLANEVYPQDILGEIREAANGRLHIRADAETALRSIRSQIQRGRAPEG